jgi:hypothetical protein
MGPASNGGVALVRVRALAPKDALRADPTLYAELPRTTERAGISRANRRTEHLCFPAAGPAA